MGKTIAELEIELDECAGVVELITAYITSYSISGAGEKRVLSGLNMLSRRLMEISEYYNVDELTRLVPQGSKNHD
jgi:hypothetical protein